MIATNAQKGVTWLHAYVSDDLGTTFYVQDGLDPEATAPLAVALALAVRTGEPQHLCPLSALAETARLTDYFNAACERMTTARAWRALGVPYQEADALTNQEIAERLYLYRRTVDHQVSAILGKPAVGNRRHAAQRVQELGTSALSR